MLAFRCLRDVTFGVVDIRRATSSRFERPKEQSDVNVESTRQSLCVQVIRLIHSLGLRPRRTVRGVLFVNEENGARGGQQYARDHASEMNRWAANGTGRLTDVTCRTSDGQLFDEGCRTVRPKRCTLAVIVRKRFSANRKGLFLQAFARCCLTDSSLTMAPFLLLTLCFPSSCLFLGDFRSYRIMWVGRSCESPPCRGSGL